MPEDKAMSSTPRQDLRMFLKRPLTEQERALAKAFRRYWEAETPSAQREAYLEILLLGGNDGYPAVGNVRQVIARWLRTVAARVDRFGV